MAQAPKHTHQASWTAVTEARLSLQHVPPCKTTTLLVCLGSYCPLSPPHLLATCGDFFRFSDSKDQIQELKYQKKPSLVLPVGIKKSSKDVEAWREASITEKVHLQTCCGPITPEWYPRTARRRTRSNGCGHYSTAGAGGGGGGGCARGDVKRRWREKTRQLPMAKPEPCVCREAGAQAQRARPTDPQARKRGAVGLWRAPRPLWLRKRESHCRSTAYHSEAQQGAGRR